MLPLVVVDADAAAVDFLAVVLRLREVAPVEALLLALAVVLRVAAVLRLAAVVLVDALLAVEALRVAVDDAFLAGAALRVVVFFLVSPESLPSTDL
ncbi:hypothetical protein SADO_04620 [Salinisphaera dokdonensis CL-ES53]|uniref:Uncharacterized protein n=1 Tax=Salinisphaera dokdonensis CL-ES53 TaxID=1304272 RepID=A0ABV2AXZ5_9GAMM